MPANSTFTEIVSTTLREHPSVFFDNVSNNNALLNRINKRGNLQLVDGGYEIVEPLDYAENSTAQWYSGYDTLNVSASDVLSAANFAWKQLAVHVTASGLQIRQNSGKNQIMNLVKARIKNAMRTFTNTLGTAVYNDGLTASQIGGLQFLVADAGTGTVGGINSTDYTFWRNAVQSAASPLDGGSSITLSATTMEGFMLQLYTALCRGMDMPDLIVASNNYYNFYEASQTSIKRYADNDMAQGGFLSLKYKKADVIFDGGTLGSGIPTSHMYFLNTDFLKLKVHKDANMEQLDQQKSINQDAVVIPVIWQGNLTVSNRSLQGVAKA